MKRSDQSINELSRLPPVRWFLFAMLGYLLVTLLATSHNYHSLLSMGEERNWSMVFSRVAPNWMVWAILTPVIVRFVQRHPWNDAKRWHSLFTHLIAAVLFLLLNWMLIASYVFWFLNPEGQLSYSYILSRYFANPFHIHWGIYLGTVTACFMLQYYHSFHRSQLRTQQLEKGLLEAELQALRSQLNPHFLFNTLNAIVSLIRTEDKARALQATNELSQLLRFVLQTQGYDTVPLSREWAFMDLYFSLQKLRFADRLQLDIQLDERVENCLIPPLLLQPLFENAIEHGSKLISTANHVQVEATLDQTTNMVTVRISNNYTPLSPRHGFGIGLNNTRTRLNAFFGTAATLEHHQSGPEQYTAILSFPAQMESKDELPLSDRG